MMVQPFLGGPLGVKAVMQLLRVLVTVVKWVRWWRQL
jgi:hypothetical protein